MRTLCTSEERIFCAIGERRFAALSLNRLLGRQAAVSTCAVDKIEGNTSVEFLRIFFAAYECMSGFERVPTLDEGL
jgi:hypothetical protein